MNMTGHPGHARGLRPRGAGLPPYPRLLLLPLPVWPRIPACGVRCARFLETVIEAEGAENIAAFIAEPELGASGFLVPPKEYWPIIREICTKYDVAMIADEVMCGFCRTGTMFCIEHWNVVPDVMAMSKGITGGYVPFGAVAFNDKIWDGLRGVSLMHQYTFSGAPIALRRSHGRHRRLRERGHRGERDQGRCRTSPSASKRSSCPCRASARTAAWVSCWPWKSSPTRPPRPCSTRPWARSCRCSIEARQAGLHLRQMGSNRIVIAPPCTTTIAEADSIVDILQPLVAAITPPDARRQGGESRPAQGDLSRLHASGGTDLQVRGRQTWISTTQTAP